MRADESYLLLSDVAVTFRSGLRSKWHARQIYRGLLERRACSSPGCHDRPRLMPGLLPSAPPALLTKLSDSHSAFIAFAFLCKPPRKPYRW